MEAPAPHKRRPTNALVTPLLTDLYQITMTYAHWKNNRHDDPAVFELFFRKNPFGGEYTIFAGLDEALKHLENFHFTVEDIEYLKTIPSLGHCDPEFFQWMLKQDTSQVTVRAVREGTVVFPRVPLMIIEAPLAMGQLLETTLLTLINYPSLIATNAARMVLAAAPPISLKYRAGAGTETPPDRPAQCYKRPICVEFGLRRAQGPDGGFSASKYASMGGFVATSNVQAGKLCGLTVAGTHAHAFVQAYSTLEEVSDNSIVDAKTGESVRLLPVVLQKRKEMERSDHNYATTNDGELAAFIAYATAFPSTFLCLIDTYDTLKSGLLNFVLVAMVLDDLGYQPAGIRLDSGDLAYLSFECALTFQALSIDRPFFSELSIVASNDINEAVLHGIMKQDHAITTYGIGTNLVTCQGWF
jgi:nicotinate phosphoribosyltransferase